MDASVAVVMEMWLSDGTGLEEDLEMLEAGTGIASLCLNRDRNTQGFSHGGVAILYHTNRCTFKKIPPVSYTHLTLPTIYSV